MSVTVWGCSDKLSVGLAIVVLQPFYLATLVGTVLSCIACDTGDLLYAGRLCQTILAEIALQ